eukprot:2060053-Lingulodinium_polyedra.AAC.1
MPRHVAERAVPGLVHGDRLDECRAHLKLLHGRRGQSPPAVAALRLLNKEAVGELLHCSLPRCRGGHVVVGPVGERLAADHVCQQLLGGRAE